MCTVLPRIWLKLLTGIFYSRVEELPTKHTKDTKKMCTETSNNRLADTIIQQVRDGLRVRIITDGEKLWEIMKPYIAIT